MKKIFILTLIVFSVLALGTLSVSAKIIESGKCGENLTWTLDSEGLLTISGSGAMYDYDPYSNYSPLRENAIITSAVIENGVTSIGNYMFSGCSGLAKVSIPASVTRIGISAFGTCSGLTRVDITDIGAWCKIDFGMFSNPLEYAKSLYVSDNLVTDLVIPDGVKSIGNYAFYRCSTLTSVTIPDSVESIGDNAFGSCTALKSVILGNNLKSIGDNAFRYCTGLTSIAIPNSITSIGDSAFDWCDGLKRVDITSMEAWCNITFGASASNPLFHAKKLYLNNTLVSDLYIPNGVQSIGNYTFQYCTSLTSVTFPTSVQSIGDYAFQYCSGLKRVTIGDNVTSIGQYAFRNCYNLTNASLGGKVELISEYAFYNCSKLRYVGLPSTLRYIKNDAFNNCTNIENVFYESSQNKWEQILFYNRNEKLTNATIVYNATKKVYKFETNCENTVSDITDYAVFAEPAVTNGGMIFTGWYDNKSLIGNAISFPYYGEATILYAGWINGLGTSFEDAFFVVANQEYSATTTTSGQLVYFKFIPNRSKEYRFYSQGKLDTYGYLYDNNRYQLISDDNDGERNNFYISYDLIAGQTYYIVAKCNSEAGTFTLVVEEPVDYIINSITIKDMSGNALSTIPTGTFLSTVSFTNVNSSEDTVIILAQYTTAGVFNGLIYTQTQDVPTGSTIKLSIPVDNSKGNIAKLKAFCWGSFGSLTPLGNSASFPLE